MVGCRRLSAFELDVGWINLLSSPALATEQILLLIVVIGSISNWISDIIFILVPEDPVRHLPPY
jgi:hypothetical protein